MHPDSANPELDAMRAIAERAHSDLLAEAHRRADLEHQLADTRARLETEVAHHLRTRAEADRLADELDVARDLLHRARNDAARVRAELDEVHALSRPISPSAAVDAAVRGRDTAARPESPAALGGWVGRFRERGIVANALARDPKFRGLELRLP
ncbi:hypothetical protein AMAG_14551 [Allomyces macrogynus ATCC 38327]|uniref:Uncharacterized protein n=1 Tax=Allomyces macrogynus (strain ATCC 38327) TaxID=578462 RepID=A0A0L0T6P6_ALLM3|nr:hypothetical protein AMAG_14551 [Allomyces macrogynus ATCC 38327]|eukprot:KNE70417.1 hypothetical protein AMAG_14551 [Allomyces macrogynus ATCC 38327]